MCITLIRMLIVAYDKLGEKNGLNKNVCQENDQNSKEANCCKSLKAVQ